MRKKNSKTPLPVEEQWREDYTIIWIWVDGVKCWAVYSLKWHSVRPRKKISPYFNNSFEAEKWITTRWKIHMDNVFERVMLRRS